ncbi:MAG: type IV pilus modification PilV family protein [Planctomycetota bacterium]|jgi:prepilin-type N-terminal cleavage/methylation domain-containing protein
MVKQQTAAVAGFTMMELVCAFAVLSILVSVGFLGAANKLDHVRRSYQETQALQAASGWLEQLQVEHLPLRTGVSGFLLPQSAQKALADAEGVQSVRQLEPGLYEVVATVKWSPVSGRAPVTISLKTLVLREPE